MHPPCACHSTHVEHVGGQLETVGSSSVKVPGKELGFSASWKVPLPQNKKEAPVSFITAHTECEPLASKHISTGAWITVLT